MPLQEATVLQIMSSFKDCNANDYENIYKENEK